MECDNCGESVSLSKNIKRASSLTTEKNIPECPECGEKIEKTRKNTNLLEKNI